MWWDEIASVFRAGISFHEMFVNLMSTRNHMPLYFVMLQGWGKLGLNEFVVRYFSVLAGMIGLAVLYKAGELIAGRKAGLIALFLLAISPFHIWFSQEARMYTLMMTLILAANFCVLVVLRQANASRWWWLGYTVTMILAVYTHYFAGLLLLVHYIFFSLHYRYRPELFKRWLVSGVVVGASFALWVFMMAMTGGYANAPISWIEPAQFYDPFLTLLSFVAGPTVDLINPGGYLVLGFYVMTIFIVFWNFARRLWPMGFVHDQFLVMSARLLLLWLFVPILITFIISLDWPIEQARSIYMDRYLIISLPAMVLLAAWGLVWVDMRLKKNGPVFFILAFVCLATLPSLLNMYGNGRYARTDWRKAFEVLDSHWQPDSLLLLNQSHTLPYLYYADDKLTMSLLPSIDVEGDTDQTDWNEFGRKFLDEVETTGSVWFIESFPNGNTHGFPHSRNTAQIENINRDAHLKWLSEHCLLLEEINVTGVRLISYDLAECVEATR
ncbi:MAG: glycosyltransferase family 39 protein [Anaerolineae bacterium]|nr:glycosyltransferase family 39 protein [Anaerolineae bacterium]